MEPENGTRSKRGGGHVAVSAAVLGLAVFAMGCHAHTRHIDGIESVDDVENACVDWAVTEDPPPGDIEFFGARNLIAQILEDDTQGWELASSESKINFWVDTGDCDTLASGDRVERE